jgi:hypothetical protein
VTAGSLARTSSPPTILTDRRDMPVHGAPIGERRMMVSADSVHVIAE